VDPSEPDPGPPFADVLRRLRAERGLSLRDFQRVAQHSRTLVWEWEHGIKVPTPDIAARLDLILDARGELSAAAAASTPTASPTTLVSEIARHYAHQGPVADEIRLRAADAKELDVLAVRALGLFALKDSLLRPALMDRSTALQVRILLLDPDCDAAARRAGEIGESAATFAAGIKLAVARLEEVAGTGMPVDLDVRLYSSLPIWRIIRVDETTWVSSFGASWEGHESTIYEIPYTPRGSFWAGYRRQFDDMHANARRVI
jgi:transcriptional regulator with XRE-family HTH domain